MSMDWFRHSNGMSTDDLLTFAAKKAGARRCEMTAFWDMLCEHANKSKNRGYVGDIDLEFICISQDIPIETVKSLHVTLQTLHRITENGYLKSWDKYNPNERKTAMTAAERVAKCRANKRAKAPCNDVTKDVTVDRYKCNAETLHDRYTTVTTENSNQLEFNDISKSDVTNVTKCNGVTTHNTTLKKESKKTSPLPPSPPVDNFTEDEVLKNAGGGKPGEARSFDVLKLLDSFELANAKAACDGWDVTRLAGIFNENIRAGKLDVPNKPALAFPGWLRKYTKGKRP